MTVKNKTKKTILAKNLHIPQSILTQSLGLLAHKTPTAMLLRTHFGIHTLFMKYPIDVLILDRTNHVAVIKKSMKPYDFFVWNFKHNTVLELPAGVISQSKTTVGDILEY